MRFKLVEDVLYKLPQRKELQNMSWVDHQIGVDRFEDAVKCYDEIYKTIYNIKDIFDRYSMPISVFLGEDEWERYTHDIASQLMTAVNEVGFKG